MKVAFLSLLLVALGTGCATRRATLDMPNGSVGKFQGLPIRVDLLEANEYNKKYKLPGPMPELKYVTIHNTANNATAQQERNYLNRRKDKAYISFHFAVDENEAIQIMRTDEHAWHAGDGRGDGNKKSIGVEICRSKYKGETNEDYMRSEENAVKLAAWLLLEHNLTVDDLRMHFDWSRKRCPHRILEGNRWTEFKEKVRQAMEK
ncbi:MAG: hypothetical protein GX561_09330 [Lentisphaerae bacterium]|jgi:N-acetylmuramoyl-L-alanine amidase|nr:hypothetical protein [Lentisphaerota bacterium]